MLQKWSLKCWGAISMLWGVVVGVIAILTPYLVSLFNDYDNAEIYQILRNIPVGCLTISSVALFVGGCILAVGDKAKYEQGAK